MPCIEGIQRSLDFIERNLKNEIRLPLCARASGYSPFHYCRVFQLITGMALMEYIKRRRISNAAKDIYETGKNIKEIAFDWGFNSHENFVRIFSKQFGISPSAYRKSKYSLDLLNRIHLKQEDLNYECFNLNIEPRFIHRPSFKVAGIAITTTWQNGKNLKDIPMFWNRYYALKPWEKIQEKVDAAKRIDYGLGTDYSDGGSDFDWNGSFCWLGGIEVKKINNLPDNMVGKIIPESDYAVFSTPPADASNFVENMKRTWKFISLCWLPDSGYEHAGTHELTVYCPEKDAFSKDIYIPIIKI